MTIGGVLYFVNGSGRTAPAFLFDNGADYFVEGLARTSKSGKVGFVDASLNEVVPPVWDFARPFKGGRSLVCQGCTVRPVGEHQVLRDGKWGAMTRQGVSWCRLSTMLRERSRLLADAI